MPKIYFASDHAGFELKKILLAFVEELGYAIEDLGAHTLNPDDDYPDFVLQLANRVATDPESRGIIIGGSGQGEAMAANRVRGVRAAVYYGDAQTSQTDSDGSSLDIIESMRIHNNANIIALGARFISTDEAKKTVKHFLEIQFSDDPRHIRRLAKF
ncbi:MAG: RpiB/LacA/LacB family sugar-phosphate isomerase [bacterium]